jgi:hypothetical protein
MKNGSSGLYYYRYFDMVCQQVVENQVWVEIITRIGTEKAWISICIGWWKRTRLFVMTEAML